MTFFGNADSGFLSSITSSWVYFAITIPLTASTILIWTAWKQSEERRVSEQRSSLLQASIIPGVESVPDQPRPPSSKTSKLLSFRRPAKSFPARDMAADSELGNREVVKGAIGPNLEKQTPVWYSRSKAFAWKEDLELHWGNRGNSAGSRLRSSR
jgi:hypothetical protein